MTKQEIVDVLVEVARRAAGESSATHPVDIGLAMSFAIEAGAETIDVIEKRKRAQD